MRIEWDQQKAVRNLKGHGVSFEEAANAFDDPLFALFADQDHSLAERHSVIMGESLKRKIARSDLCREMVGRSADQRSPSDKARTKNI